MKKNLEDRLNETLRRLEKLAGEIKKTSGYTRESGLIQLLKELMKEQVGNENSRYTNHSTR